MLRPITYVPIPGKIAEKNPQKPLLGRAIIYPTYLWAKKRDNAVTSLLCNSTCLPLQPPSLFLLPPHQISLFPLKLKCKMVQCLCYLAFKAILLLKYETKMCFGRDQAHCWIHIVLFCLLVIFRSLPWKSIFCTSECQVTIRLLLPYENRSKVCALELGLKLINGLRILFSWHTQM